ncbi:hypothetical protein OAT16_09595 [Prolixibacteraceae bacterium]|nr:hypothetical protein [Prolixibacteraceae bacterium]
MLAKTRAISTFLQSNIEPYIDLVVITTNVWDPLISTMEQPHFIEIEQIPSIKSTPSNLSIAHGEVSNVKILIIQCDEISFYDTHEIIKAIDSFHKHDILFLDTLLLETSTTHVTNIIEIASPNLLPFRGLKNRHIKEAFSNGDIPIKDAILSNQTEITKYNSSIISYKQSFIDQILSTLWIHENCSCFFLSLSKDRETQVKDLYKYMLHCYAIHRNNNRITGD